MAETESLTDPELLAEILEAREDLEMASSQAEVDEIRQTNSGKPSSSSSPLALSLYSSPVASLSLTPRVNLQNDPLTPIAKVEQTISSIRNAFSEDPPNLTSAKVLTVQLKYWQGLEEAAKEWTPKQN